MNRSLIIACSATKIHNPRAVPAWHRYDGPAWRTLRANVPSGAPFETFALSAEFGLISAYREIPDYERELSRDRMFDLVPIVADQLRTFVRSGGFAGDVFFFGGTRYRELLERASNRLPIGELAELDLSFSHGGIGEQLGQLKKWIRREAK